MTGNSPRHARAPHRRITAASGPATRIRRAQVAVELTCALTLLPVGSLAWADEAQGESVTMESVVVTAEQEAPYTVKKTESSTKLPLSLRETPQSVTIITRERMDDQNLQSLRDVLDSTTGVYSYAYDTERVGFTSRGFVIDNTMVDGMPGAAVLSTGSADATLDTAIYERIEVVRGATGLMTGAGSPSASINLVRKRADSKVFDATVGLSAGSWNDYRTQADISTPLTDDGKIRARLVGVYQNSESYMDLYSNEKKVFHGVIDADLTSSTLLSFGYDYQETLPQGNTWGSFPLYFSDGTRTDWRRSITTATDWSFWNKKSQTAFVDLNQQLGNDWSLRVSFMHAKTDDDLALFYVYGFPDKTSGEGLLPFAYRSKESSQQNALDLYASGPFDLFGRGHELVVGVGRSSLGRDGVYFQEGALADTGNFYEWDGSYPEPEFAATGNLITQIDTDQTAAYAALRLSLADSLKLIAGARHSQWKTDHFDVYASQTPFRHEHTVTTPYAGLIYDVVEGISAFASYTEIFNPQNNQDRDGRFLDPITGKSYEIGLKGEHLGGKLNMALTLFDTRQDNVAVQDSEIDPDTGETYKVPGTANDASVSVDGTSTRGFEMEVSGAPVKDWNLLLGWSHFILRDADDEPVKTYIPRTLVRFFTTWRPAGPWNQLTVGGGVNWQSKSHATVESGPGTTAKFDQAAVTLVSLMARYQLTPKLALQLNGDNLLDRKYYVLDEYSNLYFGPPANATIGLNYRF